MVARTKEAIVKRRDADGEFRAFVEGRVDRRDFIQKLVVAGASVTSIATLLEACSKETPKPVAESTPPAPADTAAKAAASAPAAAASDLPEIEKELHIANWSDYIAEDTVPKFEKETGIKVKYSTYESNEDLMAKLQVGAGGYDIVVPTGYIVTVLAAQKKLFPLRKQYLTNWKNIAPLFINPAFDPNNEMGVPWQWGTTGIAYRADKVKPAPDSWGVFLDPKYKNKMTQMDDQRDAIGAWLKYRGKSLNSAQALELEQAKKDSIAAKANLKAYISAPVKGQLIAGDVWVAQLWNGDTAQAKAEQKLIDYVLPKEGGCIWTDSLIIPAEAPHKRAAHEFMNFILRPDIAAGIAETTGYGTPVAPAMALMKNPVAYPTTEERARLEYQTDLGAAAQAWDKLWTEIKAA
jgi:spermidine/putrescine transport system substrate-binding protein